MKRLPTAFWLSPRGAMVPVQVHAEALVHIPEAFGLSEAPHGKAAIEKAMGRVIAAGWIRARQPKRGHLWIHVQEMDVRNIWRVAELLMVHKVIESVEVWTVRPERQWPVVSREEFLEDKYPAMWLKNKGKRR